VDSNGVGTCPEPVYNIIGDPLYCFIYSFPRLQYKNNSQALNKEQIKILDSIIIMLMNYSNCGAVLQGYYDTKIKLSEQITNARLKNIMEYLVEKGEISKSRLIANPVEGRRINTIDFISGAN
jgi:hypothetical protein